jgi:hypothetical protein
MGVKAADQISVKSPVSSLKFELTNQIKAMHSARDDVYIQVSDIKKEDMIPWSMEHTWFYPLCLDCESNQMTLLFVMHKGIGISYALSLWANIRLYSSRSLALCRSRRQGHGAGHFHFGVSRSDAHCGSAERRAGVHDCEYEEWLPVRRKRARLLWYVEDVPGPVLFLSSGETVLSGDGQRL